MGSGALCLWEMGSTTQVDELHNCLLILSHQVLCFVLLFLLCLLTHENTICFIIKILEGARR